MSKWQVIVRATVERTYEVEAESSVSAAAIAGTEKPIHEEEIGAETLSVTQLQETK